VSSERADSPAVARSLRVARAIVGYLDDGTPYFSPIGEVVADHSRVICHLCGGAFKSVAAHLTSHGWTKAQYCEAFGLERSQSLEGAQTRKLRATVFAARLVFEPAVRAGSALGHQRARTGDLTRDAANAARGRPFPEQRRRRSQGLLTPAAQLGLARANRERADKQLSAMADQIARQQGYSDIARLVQDKLAAGHSMAAISRDCGLSKDWMSRHLRRLDPSAAELARASRSEQLDARWFSAIESLGFSDVGGYLRQRHLVERATISAIANEVGLSFHTVKAALKRHDIVASPHVTKRYGEDRRVETVTSALGVDSISDYVRRAKRLGWTWQRMAAESGQSETWLRRHCDRSSR
jgi:AraC-like DNA-binding protein